MTTFQKVKLSDIAGVIDSRHQTPAYSQTGYPMVRVTDIKPGYLKIDTCLKVDEDVYNYFSSKHKSKKGDMVFSRVGSEGIVSLVNSDQPFCLGQNTAFVISKNKNNFLYYWLNSPLGKYEIKTKTTGATQRTISLESIKGLELTIPTLPIQESISSILTTYDDLIENNEKRIKVLEEMAQLLYTEWFVKFKFPGHEKVKMVDSRTEYGMIPEGWEVKSFYDVVENHDSKRKPVSSMKRQQMQGKYPYYGAAKVIDYVDDYIFDGKYLLVAEDGSVITPDGKPMLQFVNEKFWVSNHAHIVKGKLLSTEILYLRLRRFNIKPLITGSAQPKITKDNLSRVLFIVPEVGIREIFSDIVSGYFDEIFGLQKQNQILSKTRDLLIPQLVTGKRILKV